MQIISGKIDGIALDGGEVRRRLQVPRGFEVDGVDVCLRRLMDAVDCRYAYVRVPVTYPRDGVCGFDFAEAESADLCKALGGCGEAYLFAVTLGIGVDRLLRRLNLLSQGEHFITDALASAAAEALCDRVNDILSEEARLGPRFSPGYGDLPLSFQGTLLSRLQGDKTLGITVNEAYLMTPMKSVTAIAGIFD